ncbi:MAG TPA: adenylate/guanylate cyclase domain-containing protein [Kineosporiaceae bacterium]|nr:adenylate/guanylate cyclase domain-containing protein [Kineosporiaceae bacterium]
MTTPDPTPPDPTPPDPTPDPDRPTRPDELERRLLGGPRRWRRRQVAVQAGVSQVTARKLWRALGFPTAADGDVAFTDADVTALARVAGLIRSGLLDEPTAVTLARALGQTADRLVSWQTEALLEQLGAAGTPRPQDALARIADLTEDLEALLVFAWRRHLAAAASWLADVAGAGDLAAGAPLTVGFADLVSYTRLSQHLEQQQLGILVQRFEGLAADVVTAGGGRVVKTVGDEVLFTADDPRPGALIALSLAERMAVDDVVPDVRVGFAHGEVLRSLGDVYGPTVNLASRLTALARPGTVVTDPGTGALLQHVPGLVLVSQRRRQVRGFGTMRLLLVARGGRQRRPIDVD